MTRRQAAKPCIQPRPAATLILVRDGGSGPEVLLLRRDRSAVFGAGAHVFPGGGVDDSDRRIAASVLGDRLDDSRASASLGLAEGGLAYWIAAIRECFEEAGLLLATGARVQAVAADTGLRESLIAGDLSLEAICRQQGLCLAIDRLRYFSHWVTPAGPPRRFDTRFFIAPAPAGQTARACGRETFNPCWIRPAQALAAVRAGRMQAMYPTIKTLESLSGQASAAALLDSAP